MEAIYGEDLYTQQDSGNSQSPPAQTPSSDLEVNPSDTQNISLAYQPDSALTRQLRDEFIQRMIDNDPQSGQILEEQFQQHDAIAIYRLFADRYNLEMYNPAHSLAAYNVLAWLIANGNLEEPDPAALSAVTDNTAQMLSANPAMVSTSDRQMLDEELMYLFVVVHAGWQSSFAEGEESFSQYSDGIHQAWQQQFGIDLRQMALTPQGFTQR